jgi:hypothetical protein
MTRRRLGPNECRISHDDEPGLSVVLTLPRDLWIAERILHQEMTIARAREWVRWERRQEREAKE